MSANKFFTISSFKTASRCWMPVNQAIANNTKKQIISNTSRSFSSKQRCINFNSIADAHLVSNDGVLNTNAQETTTSSATKSGEETFEPTIFSSEEIHTAGPVNKL